MEESRTLEILKQLERGEINSQQAQERLTEPPQKPTPVERDYVPRIEAAESPRWMRALWIYVLLSGLVIVGLGAWIIAASINSSLLGLLCGLPILIFGALVLGLGADLQFAHWVHINIARSRRSKRPIRIAVPFPMGLVRFGLWMAKWFKPDLKIKLGKAGIIDASWHDVEEFIKEVERTLTQDGGMSVNVDDEGERVEVHIA